MQIKSSDGAMTVDYYEVKDFLGDVKKNVRLRVLTFVTETVNKKLIHINDMADELFDRLDIWTEFNHFEICLLYYYYNG